MFKNSTYIYTDSRGDHFIISEVIFKSKCCRYFGYLTPIYSVTSEEIKLIARYEIDVCISVHFKKKCAWDFSVGVQISSNNPSSWFSSEDKAEASFTQSDGTAVLDMMSCLELLLLLFFSFFLLSVNMNCKYASNVLYINIYKLL